MKQFLEVGKIVKTHGLRGQVRVQPWCDSPQFMSRFNKVYAQEGEICLTIRTFFIHRGMVVLTLEGIDTVEKAEKWVGKILYINRKDVKLEEGTYFIQDLIGAEILDRETGERYGSLEEVIQTKANDIYRVVSEKGKETLVPVIEGLVREVRLAEKKIYIRPIKGLFCDED